MRALVLITGVALALAACEDAAPQGPGNYQEAPQRNNPDEKPQ